MDAYKKTFPNQRGFGKRIYAALSSCSSVLAVAPTQSGKTGSMLGLACEYLKQPDVTPRHVFVFTPHSSREWVDQTRNRFPSSFREQIIHRNRADELIRRVRQVGTDRVLIIVDECHIGAKVGQTLHKIYAQLRLFDNDHVWKRRIKLAHFTATPCGLDIAFREFWGERGQVCVMDVPDAYVSHEKLAQQNRVLVARDLCGYDKDSKSVHPDALKGVAEIKPFLGAEPRYHIIRTPRGHLHRIVIENFRKVFPNFKLISEPSLGCDINTVLEKKPNVHSFIFIKDKLRCAKTIQHKFIGVLYERVPEKPFYHVITQSLAGRLTGFHQNKQAVVFTTNTHNYLIIKKNFWTRNSYLPTTPNLNIKIAPKI